MRPVAIYLINLDRSPKRLADMDRHLGDLGLAYQRVAAVDASRDADIDWDVDRDLYRNVHGRELRGGEIGCYKSHLKALRLFLESGRDYALILEDDAVLSPAVPGLLQDIAANPPGDAWDMLKLESRRVGCVLPLAKVGSAHTLGVNLFRSTGSAAYVVTRQAALRYLQRLWPMRQPYDHAFDRGAELGLRVRELRPLPVSATAGDAPSTIEDVKRRPRKVGPLRKLVVLGYRTRTEVTRVIAGCLVWASNRLVGRRGRAKASVG